MTVLVVTDAPSDAIESALRGFDLRRVESAADAEAAIDDAPPAAVVVDRAAIEGGGATVIQAARSAAGVVPVVMVDDGGDDPDLRAIDSVVDRPFKATRLRDAVEQALLVGEYDRTVGALFDAAQEAAADADGPPWGSGDLGRLRHDADEVLDDLVALDAPDLLAALVERPREDEHSSTDDGDA